MIISPEEFKERMQDSYEELTFDVDGFEKLLIQMTSPEDFSLWIGPKEFMFDDLDKFLMLKF